MPNQGLQALAKLAHDPTRNFNLETEFGLRLNITRGKFQARIADLEDESLENDQSTGPTSRRRAYKLEPVVENSQPIWLVECAGSGHTRPEVSDLETRYPKFSKDWTEALLEWEGTGRDFARKSSRCPSEDHVLSKSVMDRQWNSWIFQGGMMACWLAIQDDVLSVTYSYHLWDGESPSSTFTHDNAGDEMQKLLKSYPWSMECDTSV